MKEQAESKPQPATSDVRTKKLRRMVAGYDADIRTLIADGAPEAEE